MNLADSVNHISFSYGFDLKDFFPVFVCLIELKFSLKLPCLVLSQVCSNHGDFLMHPDFMNHLNL